MKDWATGCSKITDDGLPCSKPAKRICLTIDKHGKRIRHRCTQHAKADDVLESKTYQEWRRM